MVGSATKATNDFAVDPVPSYPDEDGYRTANVDYINGKTVKYRRNGDTLMDATRRALNKEGGRFDHVVDLNAPLTAALMNFGSGDRTSRIVLRLLVPEGGGHYARLVVSAQAENVTSSTDDKKTFSITKRCHTVMEIPARGTLEISSRNAAGTGMRGRTVHAYDMEAEIARLLGGGSEAPSALLFRVPLYDAKAVRVVLDKKLPVTDLLLNVTVRHGRPHLNAAVFRVSAEPDAHSLLFTPRLRPAADPAYDVSSGKAPKRVSIEDAVYQAINARVAAMARAACCTCASLAACSCGKKGRYSWTISHGQEVLSSRYGTERWGVGHIGEALLALAVVRKACADNVDATPEAVLSDPDGLCALMKRAGYHRLAERLTAAYRATGVPSLLSLLTHTSGLPHEGCLDAECSPQTVDRLLPCSEECAAIDPNDAEAVMAHIVAHRVVPNSRPDCKVRHSVLGMALLGHCDADLGGLFKGVCRELSMVGSTLKQAVLGPDCMPGDRLHRVSHLFESSTNDLCQLVIAAERDRVDPGSHPYVRFCLTPKYLVKDLGHHGPAGMTYGGWETTVVRVKQAGGRKRSHVVIYKVGERGLRSSAVVLYVPGMHLGFSCAFDAPIARLFNAHTHAAVGYGKRAEGKLYKFKNFVKALLVDLPVGLVNTAAELAFSVTPRYPAHSSAYKSECDALLPAPSPAHSSWDSLMHTSPLFAGAGVAFYPFALAMNLFAEAVDGAAHTTDAILGKLFPIRVFREDNRFYVRDEQLKATLPLAFDPSGTTRMGASCAAKHSMQCGLFRVMSDVLRDEVHGSLSIHPYHDSPKDSICMYYRGCAYVSETEIKKVFSVVMTERSELVNASIGAAQKKSDSLLRPWMAASVSAADKKAEEEKKIGVSVGGAIAAGALGGFAGAALANGIYGPRRYGYYDPYYYPYRRYPVVYPPPPPVYY